VIAQVEQLMDEVKQKKIREAAKQAAASYTSTSGAWISKGLVVKVMAEELADYYKRKGEVVAVVDQYVAQVEMLDSGDVLRIDQAQLETVRS
jgi:DNA/RNA-binding protein KIN17